jgi:hypothetical protein
MIKNMVSIEGNQIKLTRGDTAVIKLAFLINKLPYIQKPADKVIFSVKESYDSDTYMIHKEVQNCTLGISHEDTQKLEVGTYVWDVQVTVAETGQVATVGPGKIKILADVTSD